MVTNSGKPLGDICEPGFGVSNSAAWLGGDPGEDRAGPLELVGRQAVRDPGVAFEQAGRAESWARSHRQSVLASADGKACAHGVGQLCPQEEATGGSAVAPLR